MELCIYVMVLVLSTAAIYFEDDWEETIESIKKEKQKVANTYQ